MTLRQKQSLFVTLVVKLITKGHQLGYEFTFGDAQRSIQEATRLGFKNSNHTRRLAIDLNLFKDGHYLSSTESHRPLGEYWESLHPMCRWGGKFGDGNHYSLEHNGVR